MTTTTDFGFNRHEDLDDYLRTTPSGRDMWTLAKALGIVTADLSGSHERFRPDISALGAHQLSDEQSKWTSEYGRIAQVAGLLNSQEKHLVLELNRARADARRRARTTARQTAEAAHAVEMEEAQADGRKPPVFKYKDPTIAELNDLAADDPAVVDIETRMTSVQMMLALVQATRDAVEKYLNAVSREITWRSEQLKARL